MFAPTYHAFGAMNKAMLEDPLKAENKAKLVNALKYQVLNFKVMAANLKNGAVVRSLSG